MLTYDQVLDALRGYRVSVFFDDQNCEQMVIGRGNRLPAEVQETLKMWRSERPDLRQALMLWIWDKGTPKGRHPLDVHRCPQCPNRGRPALYRIDDERECICDQECPKGQRVEVVL